MTHTKHTGVASSKLNRRTLIGGSAAAATGALLAGKRSSTFAAPAVIRRQDKIALEFWGGEPEENGPGDLVAEFNETHPEIEVKYTRYVNDDTGNTQLDTALQGGTQIDVYKSYGVPRTSQRISSEAAVDLTPYVDADAEIKAWLETESVFKFNDLYYSLPTVRDPYVLIANKQMLDDAGITLPETWTVDEFREMANQLSSDTVFGTYAPHDLSIPILGPNRWFKGEGTESNFDDPAFRTSLEFHRGMIDEGSSYPWTDVLARDLRVYQQGIFLTEQTALWPSSSFVLRYVNDLEEFPHEFITTFTAMPTPTGVTEPWTPGTVDNNILINPNTENVEAAWEFVRFRVVEGAHHYLKSAKQPAFPGTPVEEIVAGILGPDRDTLYDVAAYTRVISAPDMRIPTDTIATASAQIQQIYQAQSDLYLIGEIDLDTALTEIKTQADAAIAQAGQ